VLNCTDPDVPALLIAAVAMVTAPDPEDELAPDINDSEPPSPAPVVEPATTCTFPALEPEPTIRLTEPAVPPVADPDTKEMCPELPPGEA